MHAQGKGRRQPMGEGTIVAHSERGILSMHEGKDDGSTVRDATVQGTMELRQENGTMERTRGRRGFAEGGTMKHAQGKFFVYLLFIILKKSVSSNAFT